MKYLSKQFLIWTMPGIGTFLQVGTLMLIGLMFADQNPQLFAFFFVLAFVRASWTMLKHILGWYRYIGGASPSQIARSYNKQWNGSVKNGPVTTVIKQHNSGHTP